MFLAGEFDVGRKPSLSVETFWSQTSIVKRCVDGSNYCKHNVDLLKGVGCLHCGSLQSTGKHSGTIQPERGKQAVEVVKTSTNQEIKRNSS